MRYRFDDKLFYKQMKNIIAYAEGFIDGTQMGKQKMLANFGQEIRDLIGEFIDSHARMDPYKLHHVYEWYQTGQPGARLFEVTYLVNQGGVRFGAGLTQSQSLAKGARDPFYDKAKIMESGKSVVIRPKNGEFLKFEINGETVFSRGPISVNNPGGTAVPHSFEETFKSFFTTYASQALFNISGFSSHFKTNKLFKTNLASGSRGGRPVGISTGIRFISGGQY